MSDHWKELFDETKHLNHMWGPGCDVETTRDQKLDPRFVYFVRACGFTFEFHSTDQLDTCLRYFSTKIRPSSRIPWDQLGNYGGDSSECQRWFDKLPQELFKDSRRTRVVKALEKARLAFVESQAGRALRRHGGD